MADINIGSIYADLDIRTGNLDRGLARARQAMDACEREAEQLTREFNLGSISASDFNDRMTALNATINGLTSRMNAAYGATRTLNTGLEIVNKNANNMVGATSRMGVGMMQLGYIADDLQYGFSGVLNNIAPLIYGFGGSAGLTAGVQAAAVAGYQLYVNFDKLQDALGVGPVRSEAEQMERLAKATSRTAEETAKLNEYKKKQADIAKMLGGQSQQTGDVEKAVQDIFNEAGPKSVAGALAAKMRPALDAKDQRALDHANVLYNQAVASNGANSERAQFYGKRRDALASRLSASQDQEGVERAKELMAAAKLPGQEGADARKSIMAKFADPNDEMHNLASSLEGAAPRAMDAAVDQFKKTERPKRAQDKERAHERAIGRMAFLEEKAEKGTASDEEKAELVRLQTADIEKQRRADAAEERADRASRQRAVGRLQFLDEQAGQRKLTDNEQDERTRLRKEADDKDGRKAARIQAEAQRAGVKAAPGGTKEIAEQFTLSILEGAMDPAAARKAIADRLKENGATDMESELGSGKIMGDAAKKVEGDFYKRMLNGKEQATSRVFDSTALASTFQSSVGGAKSKELSELELMRKNLDTLAKQGQIKFVRVKK